MQKGWSHNRGFTVYNCTVYSHKLSTYGHSHTVVLFVCAATSEEADDEDDCTDDDEQYGRRTDAFSEEIKVCGEFGLDDSSCYDQTQPSKLKI